MQLHARGVGLDMGVTSTQGRNMLMMLMWGGGGMHTQLYAKRDCMPNGWSSDCKYDNAAAALLPLLLLLLPVRPPPPPHSPPFRV
jgi:hypothetical protein